jgi:hypothetical protein
MQYFKRSNSSIYNTSTQIKDISQDQKTINCYWLFNGLFKHTRQCFFIEEELNYSLCVVDRSYYKMLISLYEIAAKENLTITYDTRGITKSPKNVSAFLNDMFGLRYSKIRLSNNKNGEILDFTIEVWNSVKNYIAAPKDNLISRKVYQDSIERVALFDSKHIQNLRAILRYDLEDDVSFDIDCVLTWVNSGDEEWQKLYLKHQSAEINDNNGLSRFLSRDELKFSLRSLEKNAEWIRKIFIVSNCKPPLWIDTDNSKIRWVYHEETMDTQNLPTFNSHAIEASLHKIDGLSEHFIYLNDDFFLARPAKKSDFFYSNGLAKIRLESFGNVNGNIKESDASYLNAARNCQKILEKEFHKSATQFHTHSPFSLLKSTLFEIEEKYPKEIAATRSNKFRDIGDISVASFLHAHYAYLTGKAVKDYTPTLLIKQNHNFSKIFRELLAKQNESQMLPLSFCINDGENSCYNKEYNKEILKFLNQYFCDKSRFEK